MALRNVTRHKLTIRKDTVIAKATAANIVPPILAPHLSTHSDIPENAAWADWEEHIPQYVGTYSCQQGQRPELTDERCNQLFSKLDLSSIETWPEADQQKVTDLLKQYHHLFVLEDLELGVCQKSNIRSR